MIPAAISVKIEQRIFAPSRSIVSAWRIARDMGGLISTSS
jgi:hypothetical protein